MEERYDDIIEKIVNKILSLKLEIPAIVLFESIKPLSYLTSQFLVFLEPFIQPFFSLRDYKRFYRMIENRENIEKIIETIEKKMK